MKKLLLPIIIVLLAVFGYILYTKKSTRPIVSTLSTFRSSNLGITFKYPKELTVTNTSSDVIIHHEVPFEHHDFCDFKGEATTTIPNLTDLNVKMHVTMSDLVTTMKTESPYIPSENFVNGAVVPSPGFIDPFDTGTYKGFAIFEGAEGCGHTVYYLKVSDTKTLVVTSDLITVFTGAIDAESVNKALAVPGVINKESNYAILLGILQTTTAN